MKMTNLAGNERVSHLALSGRFDATGAEEIDARFSEATAGQQRPAIVDVSAIDFMASRGIGLLVANAKKLMRAGHKLVLLNPQGMVAVVLKSSKMDKVMPIVSDLDEALSVLGIDPAELGSRSEDTGAGQAHVAEVELAAVAGDVLRVTIKNQLSELDSLNAKLAEFLAAHAIPSRAAYAVDLAIEELVVNVINYAYVDDEEHFIDLTLGMEKEQLVLQIVDDGRPFDPRKGPALNPHAEDREFGGLGLILVLDLVDTLSYERLDDKNRVEVRVHLFSDPAETSSETASGSGE